MSRPLVVLDADVLGGSARATRPTVRSLLRELAAAAPADLLLAAITRHPELVPRGSSRSSCPPGTSSCGWPLPFLGCSNGSVLRSPISNTRCRPGAPRPSVVTVHDLSFERDPSVMSWRDRTVFRLAVPRSARRADRVIAVSELTKRDVVDLYGIEPEKVVVTPLAADPRFGPDGPAADGGPYVLFVGGLQPRKEPTTAIEALSLIGSAAPRIVLAGPDKGGRAETEAAAARLGVRAEFRGHVSQEELAALYRGAGCLVFPSRYEGFGLPVLEAMASGTPVVATTAGALPEVAGDAAVLVEPGNAPALAGGIERALADRERLRAAGLARAARYSWAETARRTLEVYRELLA